MLDYGALPPEVNSGRMYAGPGSAPMMAAAAAWRELAAELASAADSFETVITQLTSEEWLGPASASMTAAATPHIEWMSTTAGQAEQAASQATAAAAAFEAAHAATVPPAAVAANRTQLATLVSTNILGINTAAIAATEAHYAEMWAQDAAAMFGYAGASAAAAQVTPFTEPTQTTNPAGLGNQAGAVGQAAATAAGNTAQTVQMISSLPNAIQSLSSPLTAASAASTMPWWAELLNSFLQNASWNGAAFLLIQPPMAAFNSAATAAAYIPSTLLPSMLGYLSGPGFNALGGGTVGSGLGALLAPGGPLSNLGALGGGVGGISGAAGAASAISGSMGHASAVGALSVPSSWAAATPAGAGTGVLQASSWSAAPESHSMAAMPGGMPMGAGRGSFGFGTPRYGFKPTVMPRPVIAG